MLKRPDHKAQVHALASELQRSVSVEGDKVKQLVGLLFDEAKHKLVDAAGDDLLRVQGEARVLRKLYSDLTRPALNVDGAN